MAELADATDLKSVTENKNQCMGSNPIRGNDEVLDDLDKAIIYLSPIAFGTKDVNLLNAVHSISLYIKGERHDRQHTACTKRTGSSLDKQKALVIAMSTEKVYTLQEMQNLMISVGYASASVTNHSNLKCTFRRLQEQNLITYEWEENKCRRWGKTRRPCKIRRI